MVWIRTWQSCALSHSASIYSGFLLPGSCFSSILWVPTQRNVILYLVVSLFVLSCVPTSCSECIHLSCLDNSHLLFFWPNCGHNCLYWKHRFSRMASIVHHWNLKYNGKYCLSFKHLITDKFLLGCQETQALWHWKLLQEIQWKACSHCILDLW